MILDWLHRMPLAAAAFVICVTFLLPAILGSILVQPRVARIFRGEKDINTVLGFVLNAFSLYFGVLVALLSIAVFENHNKAQETIENEAAAIILLDRSLRAYPEPLRSDLRAELRNYLDEETGPGWADQQSGRTSPSGNTRADQLHARLVAYNPAPGAESFLHTQTLDQLSRFEEARRTRTASASAAVPRIMWFVVIVGVLINVVVVWMFDVSRMTHVIIGGTLSMFIGLVIFMIAILDEPFRGSHGLKPDALIAAQDEIQAR